MRSETNLLSTPRLQHPCFFTVSLPQVRILADIFCPIHNLWFRSFGFGELKNKNQTRIGTFLPLWPYWLRLALDGHQDQNGMLQICHKSILQEPSDDLMGPL